MRERPSRSVGPPGGFPRFAPRTSWSCCVVGVAIHRPSPARIDAKRPTRLTGARGKKRRCLEVEQETLALHAAAVPGERAGAADHPVAWHHDRDRVAAVREPDRARRPRAPDAARELSVTDGLAVLDVEKLPPDRSLKLRPLHPQWQRELRPLA